MDIHDNIIIPFCIVYKVMAALVKFSIYSVKKAIYLVAFIFYMCYNIIVE